LAYNGLGQCPHDLHSAAVGVQAGVARWPKLASPADMSGAKPLSTEADRECLSPYFDCDKTIDVPLVSFADLLGKRPHWDLVHMDVQGSELELCNACRQPLAERVRYLVVGTHWRSIDGQMMDLMFGEGWALEYEKPAVMKCPVPANTPHIFHHTAVDGVQVWRNPRID